MFKRLLNLSMSLVCNVTLSGMCQNGFYWISVSGCLLKNKKCVCTCDGGGEYMQMERAIDQCQLE